MTFFGVRGSLPFSTYFYKINFVFVFRLSPIIIEDSNRIIFFPTTSPRLWDCSWIAFNNIKNYIKGDKTCELILKNNRRVTINMSYNSLENQILRASKLWCAIEKNSRIINN